MSIKRILVADDEESIRWVLSKSLTKQGYQVDLASNGREALLLSRKQTYDLAVLDIKMPGLSGLELLSKFREECPQALVIIMTAESSMKNANKMCVWPKIKRSSPTCMSSTSLSCRKADLRST